MEEPKTGDLTPEEEPNAGSDHVGVKYPSDAVIECMRTRRKQLGMTYQEIEKSCGIPCSTVAKVLRRETANPTFDTIAPIARALGISLDTLTAANAETENYMNDNNQRSANEAILEALVQNLTEQVKYERRSKTVLFIILIILVLGFVAIMIYDIMHPTIGWVEYSTAILPARVQEAIAEAADIFTA